MSGAPPTPGATPFASYWQAGYEGADHVNRAGIAQDINRANGHLQRARADYLLLHQFGIRTVRESVGWRLVERDGGFDFSLVEARARAAQELGLQICWTFCHYGWPQDLDVYGDQFVPRFARYCTALATFLAPYAGAAPVYSPINEISFTSWGLSVQLFRCNNMAFEHAGYLAKRQLVRAAIAGCDAIWQVTPGARILHCDPLIHIVAPPEAPHLHDQAEFWRMAQYEAWDMLCGRHAPELGGAPRYLDVIGLNYYDTNQWETATERRLWWHLGDQRRRPLHLMLEEVQQRYHRPLLLAETGHVGSGRGMWIREVAQQAAMARQRGVELLGVCVYPAIDRPDWENAQYWHRSGLWDVVPDGADAQARLLPAGYGAGLRQAQALVQQCQRGAARPGPPAPSQGRPCIIVFSHLRWDMVVHRPRHIMTELARHYQVLYVEEPSYGASAEWHCSDEAPNLRVYRPRTPSRGAGFHDDQLAPLQALLASLAPLPADPIVWFCTPMALPLLAGLQARLVVYDCMDQLAAFKDAPKQMIAREAALLRRADLVFTGGASLQRAMQRRHGHTHCFPGSVDALHFEPALDRSNGHPLQADMVRPRLGFYGVIDERFDTVLVAALADAHPEWQIVLVGPVRKIAAATLPQRRNIAYLGAQPYQALPQFLAGWDLCLLPYARNAATRFISPTKLLEYMAAQLPIVSTAIRDVAQRFGAVIAIAPDRPAFIAACEAALAMDPAQRAHLAGAMQAIVAATSWAATASAMRSLLEDALARTLAPAAVATAAPVAMAAAGAGRAIRARRPAPARVACAIIGAGATGLSAAYHLDANTILLERRASMGGDALVAGFLPHIKGRVELNADVVHIDPSQRRIAIADGRRIDYDQLISTMPMPALLKLIGAAAPAAVRAAAAGLQHGVVRAWLAQHAIMLAGHDSEAEPGHASHANQAAHAFLAGKKAAEHVDALRAGSGSRAPL